MSDMVNPLAMLEAHLNWLKTPAGVASMFCEMDDDAQAQFFVHVANIMNRWGNDKACMQIYAIGKHMRTCTCVTDDAREWLRDLVSEMNRAV